MMGKSMGSGMATRNDRQKHGFWYGDGCREGGDGRKWPWILDYYCRERTVQGPDLPLAGSGEIQEQALNKVSTVRSTGTGVTPE